MRKPNPFVTLFRGLAYLLILFLCTMVISSYAISSLMEPEYTRSPTVIWVLWMILFVPTLLISIYSFRRNSLRHRMGFYIITEVYATFFYLCAVTAGVVTITLMIKYDVSAWKILVCATAATMFTAMGWILLSGMINLATKSRLAYLHYCWIANVDPDE